MELSSIDFSFEVMNSGPQDACDSAQQILATEDDSVNASVIMSRILVLCLMSCSIPRYYRQQSIAIQRNGDETSDDAASFLLQEQFLH